MGEQEAYKKFYVVYKEEECIKRVFSFFLTP